MKIMLTSSVFVHFFLHIKNHKEGDLSSSFSTWHYVFLHLSCFDCLYPEFLLSSSRAIFGEIEISDRISLMNIGEDVLLTGECLEFIELSNSWQQKAHWIIPSLINHQQKDQEMDYVIISIVALLVSGLTFFSGFGLGTLLMPAFALFFPIEVAVAATAIVHLANNIFKLINMFPA